jgi:Domain of unknown function (DUF4383)
MDLPKAYITIAGVLGVVTGLVGFIDNPFIGDPAHDAIFATDALHNLVHIATGLLALWIGLGMRGQRRARGITWFGVLYLVLFVVLLISPRLFGLFQVEVNNADHFLHATLGIATLAVGLAAVRAGAGTHALLLGSGADQGSHH